MRPGFKTSAGREVWPAFGALLFLALVPFCLFYPVILSKLMIYGSDVGILGFATHAELLRSLAAHQWPLWMPEYLGGMPGIASSGLTFLFPSDLLSSLAGWTLRTQLSLDAFLAVALSGMGMFLFLRRLDRSVPASLLGAFFYATSGSQISQLFGGYYNFLEGIALVPWAFWAAQKARQESSWFAWGLCGAVFALQILSVSAQLFAYTLPAVAVVTLAAALGSGGAAGAWKKCLPVLQGLSLALGLAFLLSAPQLWLSLQYLPWTERQGFSHAQFVAGSMDPSEALAWLVPGAFGWRTPTYIGSVGGSFRLTTDYFGLLPWALAAAALAALWRKEARVRWMCALALAAFVVALRQWNPVQALFFHLPIVKGFQLWTRVLFLVTLAACSLAAFGWDALRSPLHRRRALLGIAAFFAVALLALALVWRLAPERAAAAAPSLVAASDGVLGVGACLAQATALVRDSVALSLGLLLAAMLLLGFTAWRPRFALALALALAFHAVDQAQVVRRFVTFVDPAEAAGIPRFRQAPPRLPGLEPWRVFDYDAMGPNIAPLLGYESMCGTASMPLRSYMRIADAMGGRREDWYDLFSARYVFVHSKPGSAASGDTVTVYENKGAFPRAWLVGSVRKVSGDAQAYALLADPRFNPRVAVALTEDPGLGGKPPQGAVRWIERSPQTCGLDVSTDAEAVLVLSDNWYPSWRARVDGVEAPLLKADGGLQAVLVPAGRHQVDIRFDETLFYDALAACLAGLVALFGLARYDRGRAEAGVG